MNRHKIIAWMDDLQMSAHLAKLSTIHSYDLAFSDTIDAILGISAGEVLIIDLNSISEKDLKQLDKLRIKLRLTFLGFCEEINGPLVNYFKEMGCDFVFKRYELMKNLGSILNQIFNAARIP